MLITSPLSVTAIVVGKYLAAVAVYLITLLVTVLYPVMMSFFALLGLGWWKILGGYIGLFLLGPRSSRSACSSRRSPKARSWPRWPPTRRSSSTWIIDALTSTVPAGWLYGLGLCVIAAAALALIDWPSTRTIPATVATRWCWGPRSLRSVLTQPLYEGLITK